MQAKFKHFWIIVVELTSSVRNHFVTIYKDMLLEPPLSEALDVNDSNLGRICGGEYKLEFAYDQDADKE